MREFVFVFYPPSMDSHPSRVLSRPPRRPSSHPCTSTSPPPHVRGHSARVVNHAENVSASPGYPAVQAGTETPNPPAIGKVRAPVTTHRALPRSPRARSDRTRPGVRSERPCTRGGSARARGDARERVCPRAGLAAIATSWQRVASRVLILNERNGTRSSHSVVGCFRILLRR